MAAVPGGAGGETERRDPATEFPNFEVLDMRSRLVLFYP
jgi:hypothetical protein